MKTDTIYYLANEGSSTMQQLVAHYGSQGFCFIPWDIKAPPALDEVEYLLLLEPFKAGIDRFAVSLLWKQWLYLRAPHIRLVVGSFTGVARHSNVLRLLYPPPDLAKWLTQVKTIAEFPFYHADEITIAGIKIDRYKDTWELGLPHSGEPAKIRMKRFIDGHDRSNSFFEQVGRIRGRLINLKLDMENKYKDNKPSHIVADLKMMQNRWAYYKPLLEWMPFWKELAEVEQYLEAMAQIVDHKNWHEDTTTLTQQVEVIRDVFTLKVNPIVFAEENV